MGSDGRGINQEMARLGKVLGLELLPQSPPDAACFPAAKAHVDPMPGAQLRRQIAPGTPHSIQIQNGFQKIALGQFRRRAGLGMFGFFKRALELLPMMIADQVTGMFSRHPKRKSVLAQKVHIKIREQNLER